MDLQTLKKLVRQGEHLHLEFKLKATHPDKITKEAVSFANAEGGIILLGVDDDKNIKGVKFPEEDEFVLAKAFSELAFPAIKYELEKIVLENDREILIFHIDKSPQIHYLLENAFQKQNGKAYIRVNDKCVKASKEVHQIIKGRRSEKNIKFYFKENEKNLMQFLDENKKITVQKFAELVKINPNIASKTLVLLTLGGVLEVVPDEMEDFFVVKPIE
ncbi:MAG: ATP-binding protein [Bacteroidetes bacterium]|nr:MAG: ATP-binding protein [Bacteroidota bacterium]TAG94114.1 MAG: ATP-binding protein [Bacteroidota bacterium]